MDESLPQTTPLTAAQQMQPFTITHFILIALFVALAVYILWRGQRLKRRRRQADAELLESGQGFRVDADPVSADATPDVPETGATMQPRETAVDAVITELTVLKGVGPRVAARLTELGVDSLAALAALSPERAAAIDAELGNFAGRMARDKWVEQARLIVAGDLAGYERQFGKLDRAKAADLG